MLSTKKNILQTVALLKSYGVKHIVLSPGSRNAPLIQTFTQDAFFDCHLIVDERNAGFYALGMIQYLCQPVAICCTSGSSLLNYAPAVSEAYYQQLPLIVISADRSPEWIGQMDGQTIPQAGVFSSIVKKSVHIPEIKSETDQWFCNRLLNEALIACTANASGPVHINIPLSEPLFDYTAKDLPEVRKINFAPVQKSTEIKPFVEKWNSFPKRMIIVGQLFKSPKLIAILEKLAKENDCLILTEHLSNCVSASFISNFDALLSTFSAEDKMNHTPDLVLTLGGHIISKRLKHFLRENKPTAHWHITESGDAVDLYQSLTDLLKVDAETFLSDLSTNISSEKEKPFADTWRKSAERISEPTDIPFSDLSATKAFIKALPQNAQLHLANSNSVRNAQLFTLNKSVDVYCNRGVNGIESTLPSVVGFASVCKSPVYLLIGDLSFFYGLNALWNIQHIKNLRILLINNGGGGIFHLLPGLNKSASLPEYVAAEHQTDAKAWVEASGITYLSAKNEEELNANLASFFDEKLNQSMLLEVSTDIESSNKVYLEYYNKLKK